MNLGYLYESQYNSEANVLDTAVVILPEIFGITDFITSTADRFASEFNMPSFALDFFYQLTGEPNKFDYSNDMQKGIELMQKMRGEDFLTIFNSATDEIGAIYPNLQNLIVCGFCFGGRLAYVSGLNSKVNKIISFYGAGANEPNYVQNQSCIEALSSKRANDSSLSVLSLYGGSDQSIPQEDRAKTKDLLTDASIHYKQVVYADAGHAFFNKQRSQVYNAKASEQSWQTILEFINKN